jgi:hypothetical protein
MIGNSTPIKDRALSLMDSVDELKKLSAAANDGDLSRPEAILVCQAHSLDSLFQLMATRSMQNMGQCTAAADTYMRLALRAQSQCRATLETLANIKNPPVVYAKQANVTTGPQQVNNGVPAPVATRTGENQNGPSKLLEAADGERLDIGTTGTAGGADPRLETVGAIHGAKDEGGKGPRVTKRL